MKLDLDNWYKGHGDWKYIVTRLRMDFVGLHNTLDHLHIDLACADPQRVVWLIHRAIDACRTSYITVSPDEYTEYEAKAWHRCHDRAVEKMIAALEDIIADDIELVLWDAARSARQTEQLEAYYR